MNGHYALTIVGGERRWYEPAQLMKTSSTFERKSHRSLHISTYPNGRSKPTPGEPYPIAPFAGTIHASVTVHFYLSEWMSRQLVGQFMNFVIWEMKKDIYDFVAKRVYIFFIYE